jgi:hypothetical protein
MRGAEPVILSDVLQRGLCHSYVLDYMDTNYEILKVTIVFSVESHFRYFL